jgi:hypothetical protein
MEKFNIFPPKGVAAQFAGRIDLRRVSCFLKTEYRALDGKLVVTFPAPYADLALVNGEIIDDERRAERVVKALQHVEKLAAEF